jgi:hypothetical protein
MLHQKATLPDPETVSCERHQAARFDVFRKTTVDLPCMPKPKHRKPTLTYRLAPKLAPELFLPALSLSS